MTLCIRISHSLCDVTWWKSLIFPCPDRWVQQSLPHGCVTTPILARCSVPRTWPERAHGLGNQTGISKTLVQIYSNSALLRNILFQILVFFMHVFMLLLLPSSQTSKYSVRKSPGTLLWPFKLNGSHSIIPGGKRAHFGHNPNGEKSLVLVFICLP